MKVIAHVLRPSIGPERTIFFIAAFTNSFSRVVRRGVLIACKKLFIVMQFCHAKEGTEVPYEIKLTFHHGSCQQASQVVALQH